ncbi:uncharacterized protein LOC144211506 isoform X2 [Stigmatopora nigra]
MAAPMGGTWEKGQWAGRPTRTPMAPRCEPIACCRGDLPIKTAGVSHRPGTQRRLRLDSEMGPPAVFIGLCVLALANWTRATAEVEWACRDRYLWIRVPSKETVRFEAVDSDGTHAIGAEVASRCGYTLAGLQEEGFTTFRASYYSCFTRIQDGRLFVFQFNILVSDGGSEWTRSQTVSAECSPPLDWIGREITCEEEYMEVNVGREAGCDARPGAAGSAGREALALVTASRAPRLMFGQRDGSLTPLSVAEAESRGYGLTLTAERAVLRAPYGAAQAKIIHVDNVPFVVLGAFLFYKRQLTLVMLDLSVACPINSGSYDGARLIWEVPRVPRPLLEERDVLKNPRHRLEVEGQMLDREDAAAKGFQLVRGESLVRISVPFGAEGGHRRSWVADNGYKETFAISVRYEQRFRAQHGDEADGVETRLGMVRVLRTPPLCHQVFSLDQSNPDDQMFSIYLGNVPSDVILAEVAVNERRLLTEATALTLAPFVHPNGSRAYQIRLPFSEPVVRRKYLGEGVVRYSIDVNFTLTVVPREDSYYHHTSIAAQVFMPPKVTAQCLDGGILFKVLVSPGTRSLWEVGVDHQPLTAPLAAQRGYKFLNDSQNGILEVPLFSIGYTYQDINLSDFYGTFKLLLRDAQTLEVQTSTTKQCLFKTEDMIVCSADGVVTVVTKPTWTWPKVRPERTSLLDPSCRPKETDATRVLFQFKLDSCGTRATVGDYVVYENEIRHDRQLVADGPNFSSRDSQFKLTVRCFYPLSASTRVAEEDRMSRSETPGVGSIEVFGSLTDPKNLKPMQDCLEKVSKNERASGKSTPGLVTTAPVLQSPNTTSAPSGSAATAPRSQLGDGFPRKYDSSEAWQKRRGWSAAGRLRHHSASRSGVQRTPVRNWAPLSQNALLKPPQPQWPLERERPATLPISSPERIPAAQNGPSATRQVVENIRVKPPRRVHSGLRGERPHFAESQRSRGKTFPTAGRDFHVAGNGGKPSIMGDLGSSPDPVSEFSEEDAGAPVSQWGSGQNVAARQRSQCGQLSGDSIHRGIIRAMEGV